MNLPKPRACTQTKRDRRFAQRARNILQPGRGVADDREQTIKKERRDRSADADSEKWERHEQRQQRERRNRLHDPGETENDVTNSSAATRPNSKRNSNQN